MFTSECPNDNNIGGFGSELKCFNLNPIISKTWSVGLQNFGPQKPIIQPPFNIGHILCPFSKFGHKKQVENWDHTIIPSHQSWYLIPSFSNLSPNRKLQFVSQLKKYIYIIRWWFLCQISGQIIVELLH